MEWFVRFAHAPFLLGTLPFLALICWIKYRYTTSVTYQYSLAHELYQEGLSSTHPYKKILTILRLTSLVLLALLIAKPQLVDYRSSVHVEGIDIVLALDISGSMNVQDYENDVRSRIEVAKDEAKRFVDKRTNDALGLVVFGNDAVSRCPITEDKTIIKDMIEEVDIGLVDPDGTLLCTGLITAINRLKQSKATSKVVILLTDGEPSRGDISPTVAIEVAKQVGVKVYTIGIGSEEPQYMMHPLYGLIVRPAVNKPLLHKIAQETGGKYFSAHNPQDMRTIYNTIDALEKTEYETNIYNNYYDIFIPFVWIVVLLLASEVILSSLIWFGL